MSVAKIRFLCIAYVIFPNIIFVLGWLKIEIAVPIFISMMVALFFTSKVRISVHHTKFIKKETVFAIFFWALVCSLISGAGNFLLQVYDYDKHNILFNNLAKKDWPVLYNSKDFLCYYFAYYLPAGLWAKIFGFNLLNYVILLWNTIGLGLLFLQITIYFDIKYKLLTIVCVSLFLPLSFLDRTMLDINLNIQYISFLNDFLSFLYFAPQRFIGTVIILFYILFEFEYLKSSKNLYIFSLGLLWNPLAVLVMTIFVIYYLIRTSFKDIFSIQNLLMIPFCTCILLFFLSHNPVNQLSYYFIYHRHKDIFIDLFVFVFIECNVLLLIILFVKLKFFNKEHLEIKGGYVRPVLLSLTIIIIAIPIKFGFFNDLTWSSYGNLMIIVNTFILVTIFSIIHKSGLYMKFFISCFIGMYILPNIICQGKILKYNISYDSSANLLFGRLHYNPVSIRYLKKEQSLKYLMGGIVYHQYIGTTNSIFYKYLAKHPRQ